MDLTAPLSIANVAPSSGVGAAASGPPDYAARMARFDALSQAVLDAGGPEDQRLAAYADLQAMSVTGQLVGIEADRRQVLDQVTFDSDIGQRAQQLSSRYFGAVDAAGQSGGAAAALKAAVSSLDALSASDQAVLFATTLNATDRLGGRPYADIQAWRNNTEAQAKMVDYMKASGVVGPSGQLDYRAAAAKSDDAKFAAALKLSQRRDNNSADWTAAVLALFGASRSPDRLDLSPAAQKLISDAPQTPGAAQPAPYKAGNFISRTA